MLSLLKIGDGGEDFGQRRFIVSLMSNLSRLKGELLRLQEDLLSDDLFRRLGRRFGLGSGLILINIFVDVSPNDLIFVNFFCGTVSYFAIILIAAFEVIFNVVFG